MNGSETPAQAEAEGPWIWLGPQIAIAGALGAEDLKAAARAGFRSVLNNRLDGEDAGQLPATEAAAIAADLGLSYRHLPLMSGRIGAAEGRAFAEALAALPQPVLAHCRSGMRTVMAWALGEAQSRSLPEVLAQAAAAGMDLSPQAPVLARLLGPSGAGS